MIRSMPRTRRRGRVPENVVIPQIQASRKANSLPPYQKMLISQ